MSRLALLSATMKLLRPFSLFVISSYSLMSTCMAAPLALGVGLGGDFPFAHTGSTDPGVSVEAFYRLDPYEVRFHYGEIELDTYSVVLGIKHFFSEDNIRPYVEGAVGPLIVDTPGASKGLAYGFKPEVTLGVDVAVSSHFSTGVVTRYFGMIYFGDTSTGAWEANHGISLLANLIVWF